MKNFSIFSVLMIILLGCSSFSLILGNETASISDLKNNWIPEALLIVFFLLFAVIFVKVSKHFEEERTIDPLTSGSPAVPGGVTDKEIHFYFKKILGEKFPGKHFEVKIFKGMLSGDSILEYPSGFQKLNLSCVDAFYGEIKVCGININPICVLRENGVLSYQGKCKGFCFQEIVLEDGTTVPYK